MGGLGGYGFFGVFLGLVVAFLLLFVLLFCFCCLVYLGVCVSSLISCMQNIFINDVRTYSMFPQLGLQTCHVCRATNW